MLPSQYARIIHRALANPNSGISIAPPAAVTPSTLDPSLYYSTDDVMLLAGRTRQTLHKLMKKIDIRSVIGEQLNLLSTPRHRYWLKEDVDANLHTLKPTSTTGTQKPNPNLTTHTTRGKARTCPAGHPGSKYYSSDEATSFLSVSKTSLSRLAKKNNLTVEKRQIFTPNTNQTHIQSFFLKKEIHSLAKLRKNTKH